MLKQKCTLTKTPQAVMTLHVSNACSSKMHPASTKCGRGSWCGSCSTTSLLLQLAKGVGDVISVDWFLFLISSERNSMWMSVTKKL